MADEVKVIDKGWNKIKQAMAKLGKAGGQVAAVGVQGSQGEADHEGLTNAELGAIHEYGSQDGLIPERSHFRSTMDENESELTKAMTEVAKEVYSGKDPESELRIAGETYRTMVLKRIKGGIEPPLSETTIAMGRGTGPPLLDTGQYWNAITVEIASWDDKQEG